MKLLAQADGLNASSLLSEGTSYGLAVVVALGGWKIYRYLQLESQKTQRRTDLRLDRLRSNITVLTVYAGQLSRLIDPDKVQPMFPELLAETSRLEEPPQGENG